MRYAEPSKPGSVLDVVPRVDHYSQTKNLLVSFGQQPLDFF